MLVLKELLEEIHDANQTVKDVKAFEITVEIVDLWNDDVEDRRYNFRGTWIDLSNIPADLEYDDGYGSQEVFGYVLFTDDTWLEREEHDGSEGWVYKKPPTVEDLLGY